MWSVTATAKGTYSGAYPGFLCHSFRYTLKGISDLMWEGVQKASQAEFAWPPTLSLIALIHNNDHNLSLTDPNLVCQLM